MQTSFLAGCSNKHIVQYDTNSGKVEQVRYSSPTILIWQLRLISPTFLIHVLPAIRTARCMTST